MEGKVVLRWYKCKVSFIGLLEDASQQLYVGCFFSLLCLGIKEAIWLLSGIIFLY